MSPSNLGNVRTRHAKSRERTRGTLVSFAIYGVPLIVLVVGFVGYRHFKVRSTIEEVRQIVTEARTYNAITESSIKEIAPSETGPLPHGVTLRLEHSSQLAKVLGSVLYGGGRPTGEKGQAHIAPLMPMLPGGMLLPAASGATAPPEADLTEPTAEPKTARERAIRDAVAITALIGRQCAMIEDRLNVCEASGDLSMLPDVEGLIERYRRLSEQREP